MIYDADDAEIVGYEDGEISKKNFVFFFIYLESSLSA